MQGIWMSSDIHVCTNKCFHGPSAQCRVKAGCGQSWGQDRGQAGAKPWSQWGQMRCVWTLSSPLYFRLTNFGRGGKKSLLKLHLFVIYFPARQCKWRPLADGSVRSSVLCLLPWDSQNLWWWSWIIRSISELLIFSFIPLNLRDETELWVFHCH